MSTTVRLIAAEDEYDRSPGLALKGVDTSTEGFMACRNGELIAHDVMEHVNGVEAMGPVWDELEALGGVWFVRGQHGSMLRKEDWKTPSTHVASDVTRMFEQWLFEPTRMLTEAPAETDADEDFADILAKARADIIKNNLPECEDVGTYLAFALERMRAGFVKASAKHGDGYSDGPGLFKAIRDAAKRVNPEYVGQEFDLTYGDGEASIIEIGAEYEEEEDDGAA